MILLASLMLSGCAQKTIVMDTKVDMQYVDPEKGQNIINGSPVGEGVWLNDYTWLMMNKEMNACYAERAE